MKYEEFKAALFAGLKERVGKEKTLSLHQVEKNNGVFLEALVLRKEKERIAPTIYIRQFYALHKKGMEMEKIIDQILKLDQEQKVEVDFSIEAFENYEKARTRVYYKLINYSMNKAMLTKIPYVKYLDLAVVFYYRLEEGQFEGATILVHNCNLEAWGINRRRRLEDAVMNTSRKLPYTFQTMEEVITELTGGEEQEIPGEEGELMYVLTNENKYLGAAALLYPYVLNHIGKVLKNNFYVLPSSIHECILVPDSGQYSRMELMSMVREVNESQVAKEEILSYEVYYYDRNRQALIL